MKNHFLFLIVMLLFSNFIMGQEYVLMTKEPSGVYTVPCEVNGLKLRLIFDTGASVVNISMVEALFMLKNGYLSKEDIVGSAQYSMADGTISENTVVILKTLKIGNTIIRNVRASVSENLEAPLLLGQSAISQFGGFSIRGDYLIIGSTDSNHNYTVSKPRKTINVTLVNGDRYIGEIENDKREGSGTYYCKDGRKFVGQWKNNKMEGFGTVYYPDGRRYEGNFENDEINGEGTLYNRFGKKSYEGHWKNNKRDGFGRVYSLGGSVLFEGNFEDDKPNGEGTSYDHVSNYKYSGSFKNGMKEGFGKEVWPKTTFVGHYKDNLRDGDFTIYREHYKMQGRFEKEKREGKWIIYYENGNIGGGLYINDKREGEWILFDEKKFKDKWVGRYVNGKKEGDWTVYMEDGDKWVGRFINDKMDGEWIHADGTTEKEY